MMLAIKLRKAILQAAFEGKLLDVDNKMSVLGNYDINKYAVDENNKLKIDNEIPFDVPIDWRWVTLSEVAYINTGVNFKKSDQTTKGIRIYRGGNISNGELYSLENDLYLSPEKVAEGYFLKRGDILTPSVTSMENIGKVGVVYNDCDDIAHGGFVYNIRPKVNDIILSKYLFFFIQSPTTIDILRNLTNKSGQAFYNLGKAKFSKVLVPLPTKTQMTFIVEKLEEFFKILNKLKKQEERLIDLEEKFQRSFYQSVLLAAIEGKISKTTTLKEEAHSLKKDILLEKANLIKANVIRKEKKHSANEDESITIPDNWDSLNLEDIVHFTKPNKEKFSNEQVYLDVRSIREENYSKRRKSGEIVNPGDLAILVDGQNSGEIFEIKERGILGSTLRKIIINPQIHKEYALLILEFYKNKFRDNKRGSAIPHLDFQLFNTSIVPLPSLSEQIEIVEKVNEISKIKVFKE